MPERDFRYRIGSEEIEAGRVQFIELHLDQGQSYVIDAVTGEQLGELDRAYVFPATHYATGAERLARAMGGIEAELQERLAWFEENDKLLEAQRLRMRTQYDLEMMSEVGYCNGIENYSMHIDGREYGEPPFTLLDYFPDDFLMVVDESHVAVPQLHGQFAGDRSRKDVLVEHGFRLPSARDNRPLTFEEVLERINQAVFLSATPGDYELRVSSKVVEQIVRPSVHLTDPGARHGAGVDTSVGVEQEDLVCARSSRRARSPARRQLRDDQGLAHRSERGFPARRSAGSAASGD